MKRVSIVVVVLVPRLTAVGGAGQVRAQHRKTAAEPATTRRLAALEASKTPLQRAARGIDLARRLGRVTNFAVVPSVMPPGITG
ncbi:hypothetical protein ACWT_4421 [Actinoplanes sp. SE50]|uniref:hypothetical protein n=1 Tax=unclassified Actinoplanes TaxID=2626549 RepID=UPI00023ECCE8|nr:MULTISPECIES: hypothetical protein [unclassified Actinoplanes]AEV85443.1 hypothetical protein ACPL_4552 [Actinoplanes sp. SE50/110]ATO83836.1 hypothetical protein ACWT_4421 [Actinoplanes sp. SE50]SLM01246.1 hypothetical protein ACSP50_4482 [Actinoplanes sp. SE50/110]